MRIVIFGYKDCNLTHRIINKARLISDKFDPDVSFVDVRSAGVTLSDMSRRAGHRVDKFPCVFVDDIYQEPLPPEPGKPYYTWC